MAGNWLGGAKPNTLAGDITIFTEVAARTGSFTTADQALDAAREGNTQELQATGLGTFAADRAAADVVRQGVFGLNAFNDIFGKK